MKKCIFVSLKLKILNTPIKYNKKKFIFVSKNWPNDTKVGWKASSSLVELIDSKIILEEK
jgi:hypothetical protein